MAIISNATTIADAGAFSVSLGSKVHIKTLTASASATLSFLHGTDGVVLDSTYPIYKFEFINIHPATNGADLTFQADTGTNTSYNIAMTTTAFYSENTEAAGGGGIGYSEDRDQADGTAFQQISDDIGDGNDECSSGSLTFFSPSSGTFVKHFISLVNGYHEGNYSQAWHHGGYFNTTTALTRIRFKMSSGNIDSGTIKMYGVYSG